MRGPFICLLAHPAVLHKKAAHHHCAVGQVRLYITLSHGTFTPHFLYPASAVHLWLTCFPLQCQLLPSVLQFYRPTRQIFSRSGSTAPSPILDSSHLSTSLYQLDFLGDFPSK